MREFRIGPAAFCGIVLATALLLFALPFPSAGQAKRLLAIARTDASVAVVGPSTMLFVSICDSDTRPMTAMLSDALTRPVLDLSAGGQEMADSINLSAATSRNRAITDVVLPIAYPYADDWTTPSYRALLAYKAFTPRFRVFAAASREEFWQGLKGTPRRIGEAYTFEGQHYPEYNQIAATVFAREKAAARCPEPITHDRAFSRSYFWWTYLARNNNPALPGLLADTRRILAASGKRLHVIMLPGNLEVIEALQPGWRVQVIAKQKAVVAGIERAGVPVLDLTTGFSAREFGTPWCACAHLNDAGRKHLTRAIADWMAGNIRKRAVPGTST